MYYLCFFQCWKWAVSAVWGKNAYTAGQRAERFTRFQCGENNIFNFTYSMYMYVGHLVMGIHMYKIIIPKLIYFHSIIY
jgi:hypothetical protein